MTDEPQNQPDEIENTGEGEAEDESWPPKPGHYDPPVSKLLTYGEPGAITDWPNYRELGLRKQHIPDLIRMATDDGLHEAENDTLAVWAPVHAWRALGQFKATEAIQPFLDKLFWRVEDGDEWVASEMPFIFGLFGPSAIPHLSSFLDAGKLNGTEPRALAVDCLLAIGQVWDYAVYLAAQVLKNQLENHAQHHPSVNVVLINGLVEVITVFPPREILPLIGDVIKSGNVPEDFSATWQKSLRGMRKALLNDPDLNDEERKAIKEWFQL